MWGLVLGAAATLLGSAIQSRAMAQAAARQRAEIAASLQRQREYQQQAEAAAMAQAEQYQTPERAQQQTTIAQELEKEYLKPVTEEKPINALTTQTAGEVSNAYTAARSQSAAALQAQSERLAQLMAGINSAGRLRQNEALALRDTAGEIGRIGNFARGTNSVDQHAIQVAGTPSNGRMMLGSALGSIGGALMSGGLGSLGGAASSSAAAASGTGLKAGAGGGTGLRTGGGAGLRF